MSSTELSQLCGVSRFTVINWINQGRIKSVKTVGGKNRIPVTEAMSFLKRMHHSDAPATQQEKPARANGLGYCWEYPRKTNCASGCEGCLIYGKEVDHCFMVVRQFGRGVINCQGDCRMCEYFGEFFGLIEDREQTEEQADGSSKRTADAKGGFLYNVAYGIGRGVNGLKRKGKVK